MRIIDEPLVRFLMAVLPYKKIKILFYDIETTSLFADCGSILLITYYILGEANVKYICLKKDFPKQYKKNILDDYLLLKKFRGILDSADILIGQNSKSTTRFGFDLKFINHRLVLEHGLEPVLHKPEIDTFYDMARNMKFRSCKLKQLAKKLKLHVEKEEMDYPQDWLNVVAKVYGAMEKMINYGVRDTYLLPLVFAKLYKFCSALPNISRMIGRKLDRTTEFCPFCDTKAQIHDSRPHSKGQPTVYAKARAIYSRWKCVNCGLTFKGKVPTYAR